MMWGHRSTAPPESDCTEPVKPPPPIEAWLVGGPAHNTTQRLVPGLTTELSIKGHIYRRRPSNEDIVVPKHNGTFENESDFVFAAYFDHVDETGCDR